MNHRSILGKMKRREEVVVVSKSIGEAFRGNGFWTASLPMFHQQNKKGGGK